MIRLLGLVASIAFADSLNPSTIGPALYLASGERPRRSVMEFVAGTFVVTLLGGLLVTLGPGEALLALVPRPDATSRYIAETVGGVITLLAAGVLWTKRGSLGHRQHVERPPRRRRSPALLGAGIAAVELPTAFPYFAAIVAIVGSGQSLGVRIMAVAVYNVIFVLPLLAI